MKIKNCLFAKASAQAKKLKIKLGEQHGFTIIELIVAMAIFVSVLGLVVGIFVGSLRSERSLVDLMAINDNTSLALEQMAREMRVGDTFSIFGDPSATLGDALHFKNSQGTDIMYRVFNGTLERGTCTVSCSDDPSTFTFVSLTGNKVNVTRLSFELVHTDTGVSSEPDWYPRVTIRLGVESVNSESSFAHSDIQTTISARGN